MNICFWLVISDISTHLLTFIPGLKQICIIFTAGKGVGRLPKMPWYLPKNCYIRIDAWNIFINVLVYNVYSGEHLTLIFGEIKHNVSCLREMFAKKFPGNVYSLAWQLGEISTTIHTWLGFKTCKIFKRVQVLWKEILITEDVLMFSLFLRLNHPNYEWHLYNVIKIFK